MSIRKDGSLYCNASVLWIYGKWNKNPRTPHKVFPQCDQSSLLPLFKKSGILKGQIPALNFKTLLGFLYGPLGPEKYMLSKPRIAIKEVIF